MKYLKKILISIFSSLILIFVLTFLITFLNYFDIISYKIVNIFELIIPLFSTLLGGFILGKGAIKNGWLEGVKFGFIFIVIIFIINLLMFNPLNIKDFVFYILLLISSVFGSMIGISTKKENS